mmetsp:Transcript_4502/g.9551  ORF Transcript_4502/g.9551 Transcript_4502/m.9551 type:complete len:246 (-) Transcript_4502:3-740(-)
MVVEDANFQFGCIPPRHNEFNQTLIEMRSANLVESSIVAIRPDAIVLHLSRYAPADIIEARVERVLVPRHIQLVALCILPVVLFRAYEIGSLEQQGLSPDFFSGPERLLQPLLILYPPHDVAYLSIPTLSSEVEPVQPKIGHQHFGRIHPYPPPMSPKVAQSSHPHDTSESNKCPISANNCLCDMKIKVFLDWAQDGVGGRKVHGAQIRERRGIGRKKEGMDPPVEVVQRRIAQKGDLMTTEALA